MSTRLELPSSDEEEFDTDPITHPRRRIYCRKRRTRLPAGSLHTAIAIATHHLRAPLAGALANLEVLEEATLGDLSELQRRHLVFARESLVELERTVGDLLALARLQDGPVPIQGRTIDLAALVGEIQVRMEPRAQQVGVRLRAEGCARSHSVETDSKYFDYLVTELVENAIRYCGNQGTVTLRVQGLGRYGARVEVIDDGPGIPEGDAERVFDPFYQRPAHTSHQARGTGMGLAIVKRLAELLQSRITLRNQESGGCIFTVELPDRLTPITPKR